MTLRYLIEKEFKQFLRNPMLPRLVVVFPCVMLLVMPWATNSEIRNINVSVVDNDHSTFSTRLTQKIENSHYFRLTDVSATYPAAMHSIERGTSDLILKIPPRFERDLMGGLSPQVLIAANSVNGTKGALGSGYAAAIVADFSAELSREYGGMFPAPAPSAGEGLAILVQDRFNPHADYKLYMIPALIVMLLTMICGFMPALNIVSEKELGTIEQINVTPVRKFTFILGKLIPYWVIGFVVLSVCFLIAWAVYGFTPAGSVATIYLFTLVFLLVMSGLGVAVSNNSGTMQQAMFLMFFFVIIFLMMSGLFTPVESMPRWAQAITVVNPLKYFIQVMRAVFLRGAGMADLLPQLAALAAFAVGFNTWAVLSYRKSA